MLNICLGNIFKTDCVALTPSGWSGQDSHFEGNDNVSHVVNCKLVPHRKVLPKLNDLAKLNISVVFPALWFLVRNSGIFYLVNTFQSLY